MATVSHVVAQWDPGGSITLTLDDVAQTVTSVTVVNGPLVAHGSVTIDGRTFGGTLPANANQTVALPTPRPYTVIPLPRGDSGFDFGISNISVSTAGA